MNSGYRAGFHVSIAGGIANSVENAKEIGCSAFQIFSRNPRGWAAKPLAADDVTLFKKRVVASGIDFGSTVVHMPYLPNLSGPAGECYTKSVDTLASEIERAGDLGIPYLVIHLGSHLGKGAKAGADQLVSAVCTARDRAKRSNVTILLENNAGQKNNVGGTFEELRTLLDRIGKQTGVCLDTCHAFASGYDLSTPAAAEKTLSAFEKAIGFSQLKVVHLNDSKGPLGSNLDRHEHVGLGNIGPKGLSTFLHHSAIAKLPIIMETPIDEKRDDKKNLQAFIELTR